MVYSTNVGEVRALNEISISFNKSESLAIVGRSGCGKSTLISILALVRSPTSGSVIIDGASMESAPEAVKAQMRSEKIGIIFQAFHLDGASTAVENVMLPWLFSRRKTSKKIARLRAVELLDRCGLGDLVDRRPREMSGGQRQRVAIARSLMNDPALLIADEPTGSLDEDTAEMIARTLTAVPKDSNTSVVIVTHDRDVAAMADRSIRLAKGCIEGEIS
ncbi:ABC transporter ATP-binding protein [Austwickia sp. TVS 96-490-7B]|uniref:ABC transporter ATP-binding protein n=1 Tax=Austwickia sp. TVS 96-490-7B TaxID=2830843 RepID=UPI002104E3DC|nr:ABC transporter ATP-binding protein [Austwickia sp. TVS 96-490-7B]